jgi:carboxypeptidase Taq
MAPYESLRQRHRELAYLADSSGLLGWDQETHLPPKATSFRAEQLAYLAGQAHRLMTSPEVGDWLRACEDQGYAAGSLEADNLRGWKRDHALATRLPTEHVETVEHARSLAVNAWREARSNKDFKAFAPHLRKNFELARKTADYLGWSQSPYDALVDQYEEGATRASLEPVLRELAAELAAFLPQAIASNRGASRQQLKGHYPIEAQKRFNRRVAEAMGFDFERGRIDTVTHPFCGTYGPDDVRLTTRYSEDDFAVSFFGVLHEAGHGLYEQGLPGEEHGQPAGAAASLGVHESQSRTWENKIARSRPFWEYWFPVACDCFADLRKHDLDTFLRCINAVQPSFIRVEADEVTYDLHIALRFELEAALVEGRLEVEDLPGAWDNRFRELTGLTPPDVAQGCLQDVHWSHGLIGYFPTYSLGNLNSSQLYAALQREHPALDSELRQGRADSVLRWMREKVHRHGRRLRPDALLRQATGEGTQPRHHLAYLKGKFSAGT